MEQRPTFYDYTEVQASDLNNLALFTEASFDDLINDAVTNSLRFTGFNTVKSNQAEITAAPGRFYGRNNNNQVGAVYALRTTSIISLIQYLAVASTRYLTLVVYGVENTEDTETRDKLVDTVTGQVQPQLVDTVTSRDAVLAIRAGAEGPDPQKPATATTEVAICDILMDTTGVVSVTMRATGQVISTEDLDTRVGTIEAFDLVTGPRLNSLASDLASLQNEVNALASHDNMVKIYQDLAELKAKAGLPATYSDYGADFFLWPDGTTSDLDNSQSLGWHALIDMGIRFPAANADVFTLALFNSLDPNASLTSGLLIPTHTDTLVVQTGDFAQGIPLSQYTFQTFALVEQDIAYSRIRDGGSYTVCTNGNSSYTPGDTTVNWWLPNFATYETQTSVTVTEDLAGHQYTQTNYYWHDTWTEPYWSLDTITHSINGSQIAQSFLVSSDMWITKLGIYLSAVASPTDIYLTLVQCTNGVPDTSKAISHNVMAGASLVTGWNEMEIPPAYVTKGTRLALVVTSAANHTIGTSQAGSFLNGTFFFSLDGAYQLGDFTKDLMLRVYAASFPSSQVTIEFGALNLQGGIRNIDITARMIVPASCQLVFEVQPNGNGDWIPISPDDPLAPFQGVPPLARFRGRFVGTPNIAPGIQLSDSIVNIWTPDTTFTYVSEVKTLATATTSLTVQFTVENYNTVAHTLTPKIHYAGADHAATSVVTALVDASAGRYTITATFTGIPSTSTFVAEATGTTNSAADTFHVSELLYWF